jgi:hypothetical protein
MPRNDLANTSLGLGRILAAVDTNSPAAAQPNDDGPGFLVHSTRKVIEHYRRVLSTHPLSDSERATIEQRIGREEAALRNFLAGSSRKQPTYSEAA